MSKKDRVVFMNDLAKDDPETNVPIIVDKHYEKFNYAYDLIEYLESEDELDNIIKSSDIIELTDTMEIRLNLGKRNKSKKVVEFINKFIDLHNGDIIATIKTIKTDKINISINTTFIEEDKYNDNRSNTD